MPTNRQIFISCQLAVDEYLCAGKRLPKVEKLARLATVYGKSKGVTIKQALKMLQTPLCEIDKC